MMNYSFDLAACECFLLFFPLSCILCSAFIIFLKCLFIYLFIFLNNEIIAAVIPLLWNRPLCRLRFWAMLAASAYHSSHAQRGAL